MNSTSEKDIDRRGTVATPHGEVSVQVCSREIWNDRKFLEILEATYLITLPPRNGWQTGRAD